jgi:uncharacterized membrane protein YqjE
MSATDPRAPSGATAGNAGTTTGRPTGEAPYVDVTDSAGPRPDASLSDLISRLGDDITTLFRQEVELAKVELKREATAAGKAAGMLAAGAVLGFVALMLIAWAAAWGLAEVIPAGWAFLIVGLVFAAVAAGIAMAGKKKMQQVDPTPHATIETLQQDKQVLTDRSSS